MILVTAKIFSPQIYHPKRGEMFRDKACYGSKCNLSGTFRVRGDGGRVRREVPRMIGSEVTNTRIPFRVTTFLTSRHLRAWERPQAVEGTPWLSASFSFSN